MRGTITKIDDEKQGPLGRFIRVHFDMEGGGYRMLDLVKRFRNWRHWKEFLEVGTSLCSLHPMGANKLDADPVPRQCFVNTSASFCGGGPSEDETPIQTPDRPSKLHHEAHRNAPEPSRVLSHALKYFPRKDRWVCKCGYELGTGHELLYAACPIAKRPTTGTYHENKITAKPKLELFDLAEKQQKKKGRNKK